MIAVKSYLIVMRKFARTEVQCVEEKARKLDCDNITNRMFNMICRLNILLLRKVVRDIR